MENKDFDNKADKLKAAHSLLVKSCDELNKLDERAQTLAKQAKHKLALRDKTFVADFHKFVETVKSLSDDLGDLVRSVSNDLRQFTLNPKKNSCSIASRNFTSNAKSVSGELNKLHCAFLYSREAFKNSPDKLNWWELESYMSDLLKINSKITYLVREAGKIAET